MLALGGGAARGLAHIGVLKALGEAGIGVCGIAGTSMGALVGAIYASTLSADKVTECFKRFTKSREFKTSRYDFLREAHRREREEPNIWQIAAKYLKIGFAFGSSIRKQSFVPRDHFLEDVYYLVDDIRVEDLTIPFTAVAVDLNIGKAVYLQTGSLRDSVGASCAIPGLFPPITVGGQSLVDGGCIEPVPVLAARAMGMDPVIAVDVAKDIEDTAEFNRGYNVILRTNAITRNRLKMAQLESADIVIQPDIGDIRWFDFTMIDRCVKLGEEAVAGQLHEIQRLIRRRSLRRLVQRRR